MDPFLRRMIGAAKLDANTYEEVEADSNATGQALGVVVIASIASGVSQAGTMGIGGLIGGTIAGLIGWVIWALVIFLLGTKVLPDKSTSSSLGELLRTTGFAQAPGALLVLGIIPILGILVVIIIFFWRLATMVIAVRQALDYSSTGKAILVCVIGFLCYLPVALIMLVIMR